MEEAYEIWDEEENVESSQANNPSVTTQSAKQETATEKQEAAGFSHGKGKNAFWQKAGKVIAVIGKLIALVIFVSGIIIGKHKWERYMRHHKDADIAIAAIKKQLLRYMKLNGYLKEEGEAEKAYFMRAACGLWKKRIEANHGTKENRKMTAKAEESIEQLPQNSEAAGEIEPMIEAFWSVLEKQAFSRRNLVKSDVRTCNQLFDCLVEGKF